MRLGVLAALEIFDRMGFQHKRSRKTERNIDLAKDIRSGTEKERSAKFALAQTCAFSPDIARVAVHQHGEYVHVRLGFKAEAKEIKEKGKEGRGKAITLAIGPDETRWGENRDFGDPRCVADQSTPNAIVREADAAVRIALEIPLKHMHPG